MAALLRRWARYTGAACIALPLSAAAALDLSRAQVSHLDNGLTVLVLEEHSRPLVSTQMLYRSGSREEAAGHTGLAHFLEHLAFRATEAFPDGAATDAIYDAGGEWHGYTWIDQTTYFSTMPADGLELLLDIEADRMARIAIDPEGVEAEKGAVLTELHSYENDPQSVLFDETVATALQAHPYRIPTTGYERDVAALTVADAWAWYRAHYTPDNAVLAIVGDVDAEQALAAVRARFAAIPAAQARTRSTAVEPPQRGERRTRITGPVQRRHVKIVYPAPAASSADWPAFLLLQQLVSGGSGVNFRQNDWGTPAVAGSALDGAAGDLSTWFIPTADPYVFMISASIAADGDEAAFEREIGDRVAALRAAPPGTGALAAARAAVAGQLAFDLETTEDAAHQLAYFEGIGALGALLALPQRLAAVTPADIQAVARAYLDPSRRTIGWYVPGERRTTQPRGLGAPAPMAARPHGPVDAGRDTGPALRTLPGGLPAIVSPSTLSPTATVHILLSAPAEGADASGALAGLGSITRSGLAADLPRLVDEAASAARHAAPAVSPGRSEDPYGRLEQLFAARVAGEGGTPRPLLAVVSGDVPPEAAFAALERALGDATPGTLPAGPRFPTATAVGGAVDLPRVAERIDRPLPQAALGYIVPAPPPSTREGLAWRMLLYVLTHDYGGRLGDEAISARGLVYFIDSAYRSDGARSWITLATGVDPDKIDAMEQTLRAALLRLASDPPGAAETGAARRHLLGRDLSAAQSNAEIADRLTRAYVERGGLPDRAAFADALAGISPADLAAAARAFARGTLIRVDVAGAGSHPDPH